MKRTPLRIAFLFLYTSACCGQDAYATNTRSSQKELYELLCMHLQQIEIKSLGFSDDALQMRELLLRHYIQRNVATKQEEQPSPLAFKGKLGWPLQGAILHHPDESQAQSRGLYISSKKGANVSAIFHGRVVYVGTMAGLGEFVIIDHGDDVHSLYANLYRQAVKKGDYVTQGQRLGSIDQSANHGVAKLYFEVRHRGIPQNPFLWISEEGPGN